MKKNIISFLLLIIPTLANAECGKSLELALRNYLEAVNESNYEYLAKCASAEALKSYAATVQHFVDSYSFVAKGNPQWGKSLKLLKEGKITHKEFFITVKTAGKENRKADHTKIESLEFIGSVEKNNYMHVLYRASDKVELALSAQPKVFSFIQEEGQWKYAYIPYL